MVMNNYLLIYHKSLNIKINLMLSDKPSLLATNSRKFFSSLSISKKEKNKSIYWLRPGKTNFSPINQPQLINNSWATTSQHFIISSWNDHINMMTAMNCLHLLTHDIDHFHHYFGNDQETKRSVCLNETLWMAYLFHSL